MVQITINDRQIEVPEGTTVLRAAELAGIQIPRLCEHKELTPYGGCRLCIVEVQGVRVPMASCTLPVNNGMVVNTDTEALKKSRKFILSMLFSERNHFCPFCQVSGGDCELQNAAYAEEMTHWPIQPGWNNFVVDTSHPYFVLDNNRCIPCRRGNGGQLHAFRCRTRREEHDRRGYRYPSRRKLLHQMRKLRPGLPHGC